MYIYISISRTNVQAERDLPVDDGRRIFILLLFFICPPILKQRLIFTKRR